MASSKPSESELEELKEKLLKDGSVSCPLEGCSETFKSIWGLRFHMQKNSCNASRFNCEKCSTVFSTRIGLYNHRERCNGGENIDRQAIVSGVGSKGRKKLKVLSSNGKETETNDRDEDEKCSVSSKVSQLQQKSIDSENDTKSPQEKTAEDFVSKVSGVGEDKQAPKKDNLEGKKTIIILDSEKEIPDKLQSKKDEQETESSNSKIQNQSTTDDMDIELETKLEHPAQTVNRKRGRPKERTASEVKVGDDGNYGDSVSEIEKLKDEEQFVTPKKRGRKKKIATSETPKGKEMPTPQRRSSRSTRKQVNYADVDKQDNDRYDEDSITQDKNILTTSPPTQVEPEMPKRKRGRSKAVRKDEENQMADENTTDKNIDDTSETPGNDNNSSTPINEPKSKTKRVGRPKKVVRNNKQQSVSNVDSSENDNSSENLNNKSKNIDTSETDGDDVERDTDGEIETSVNTPTARRGKKKYTEEQRLAAMRRKAKKGQKLPCDNRCGSTFTSFPGFKAHMAVCGKERSTLKCELCDKEYTSLPGLKYHIKAAHEEKKAPVIEPKATDNDNNDNGDNDGNDGNSDLTPRRMRQAAARAIKKVQSLTKDNTNETGKAASPSPNKRSIVQDKLIMKLREGLITPAIMNKWKEEINKNGSLACPNEGCDDEFSSVFVLQSHYLQCGFDEAPFTCRDCGKDFVSLVGARQHVEHHLQRANDSDDDDFLDYKQEESDDDDDDDDTDDNDDDVKDELQRSKKLSKRKLPSDSRPGRIMLDVANVNNLYRKNDTWRKQNINQLQVLTEHIPRIQHWKRVDLHNIPEYIPVSTMSPCFIISRPNDNSPSSSQEEIQLPLFTSMEREKSDKYGDCNFYTGGPVWGISWCPTLDPSKAVDQYIVISSHRSYDAVYHEYKSHKCKGTLQLWSIGKLSNNSARSGSNPKLSLCIAHEFGPVYRMMWCPFGTTWQHVDTDTNDDCLPRLGLLAVACGDGIVRILSIPHPDKLLTNLPTNQTYNPSQDKEFNKVMVHCTSIMDLYPCSVNAKYDGQHGMASCVDWSQLKPFDNIAAGFSDGTVALWNLSSKSALLTKTLENEHQTLRLAPYILIKAHSSIVRDLALCPASQDIIVTGGEERLCKLWDLQSPSLPRIIWKKGYAYEIEWPVNTKGFFTCEQELYHRELPSVKYFNFFSNERVPLTCTHGCGLWSLSCNQWLNLMASSDMAGDVYLSKIQMKPRQWPLYKVHLEDHNLCSENQEKNKEEEKAVGKLKQVSPSLQESIERWRLVYKDINCMQFSNAVLTSKKEIKQKPTTYSVNESTLQAIHKVQWNPNKQALTWLASGGASGLVRIHHIKEMKRHEPPSDK